MWRLNFSTLKLIVWPWHRSWVFALCLLASAAHADIAIVVHADNPVQRMTSRQIAELYLGRSRSFETGQFAVVVDQTGEDTLRARFFKEITGMTLGQVNAFWSRLKFTGQVQPPQSLAGDAAVLDFVRRNTAAIGYVGSVDSIDPKLKTVMVLREVDKGTP